MTDEQARPIEIDCPTCGKPLTLLRQDLYPGLGDVDVSNVADLPGEIQGREVEIMDRAGNSWIGDADVALAALADLGPTDNPSDIWDRLTTAR